MSKYTLENGAVLCEGQEIAKYDEALNVVTSDAPLHHKVKAAISRIIEPNPEYATVAVSDSSGGVKTPSAPVPAPSVAIPEAPAKDPALGDKTPAYVEWFREHHSPEEFAEKYRGRRIPATLADAMQEPSISKIMPTVD